MVRHGQKANLAVVAADQLSQRGSRPAAHENRRQHAVGHRTQFVDRRLELIDGGRQQQVDTGARLDDVAALLGADA